MGLALAKGSSSRGVRNSPSLACRESSIAASSQPVALINNAAPFQPETGGSPAATPTLKAGPSHWEAQTWSLGSAGSSPQALRHRLRCRWPGLGGCDAQRSPASAACPACLLCFPGGPCGRVASPVTHVLPCIEKICPPSALLAVGGKVWPSKAGKAMQPGAPGAPGWQWFRVQGEHGTTA